MDSVDGNCIQKKHEHDSSDDENETNNNKNRNSYKIPTNKELVAPMPVSKNARYYNMNHRKRGILFVFNHDRYKGDLKDRSGSTEDCKKIYDCFHKLDFEVNVFNNLSLQDIERRIAEVAQMDHSNNDCVAIFVLTHGEKDRLLAYDQFYDPEEVLWGQFTADKCRTLAGKPKLFFIQACLGTKLDDGIKLVEPLSFRRTETDGAMKSYRIPVLSDFLLVFSTMPGFYSFRNTVNGSYFVTVLCEELLEHAYKYDIHSILTFVNQRVALEFVSNAKEEKHTNKKQAPHFQSSLTRLLVFNEKIEDFNY